MATTEFRWIPVTTLASGAELRLPLHTVRGDEPARVAATCCTPGEFGYIITDADRAEVLDG